MNAQKNEQILYVYDTDCNFLYEILIDFYAKSVNKSVKNILEISKSFKGYGYDNGNYISIKKIEKFYNTSEVTEMFNDWLKINYKSLIKKLKNMYKTKYSEEVLSDAMFYVVESINKKRSVNNFEQSIIFKYKCFMIDSERVAKNRKLNGYTDDFIIIDKYGDEQSFIQNYAKSTDSFFDTKQNYDCILDYNSIKRFDIIGYILKEFLDVDSVNLFIEILQGDFDFKNLTEIPNFKYNTLIRKYKQEIETIKNKNIIFKNISNSKYLKNLVEKCWNVMSENIERIVKDCNLHTFKNVDDYNLLDFIKN